MKITLLTLSALLIICSSVAAQPRHSLSCGKVSYRQPVTAQPPLSKLCGKITDGKKPVANLELIPANGDPVITKDDGSFVIVFTRIGPGQPTAIRAGGNWTISNPSGGKLSTQSLDNQFEHPIIVLPRGDQKFLAPDHMKELGLDIIQRQERQIQNLMSSKRTLERDKKALTGALEDASQEILRVQFELVKAEAKLIYGHETGLPLEAIEEALQRWANTPYKDYTDRDKAIQAAIRGDSRLAETLAHGSMQKLVNDAGRIGNVRAGIFEVETKLLREAFVSAQVAGNQARINGELHKVLTIYTEIDAAISKVPNFKEVFRAEWSLLRILLSTTKSSLVDIASPPERAHLRKEVIKHCKEALTVYKPDTDSFDWGTAEFLWAHMLYQSAQELRGDEQKKTLEEATGHLEVILSFNPHETPNLVCEKLCWPLLKATAGMMASVAGYMLGGERGVKLVTEGRSALTEAINSFDKEQPLPSLPALALFKLFIGSAHYILATQIPVKETNENLKTARTLVEQFLAGEHKGLVANYRDFARALLGAILLELAERTSGKETIDYTRAAIVQFELLMTNCKSAAKDACHSPESGIVLVIQSLHIKGELTEAKSRLHDFITKLENQLTSLPSDPPDGRRLTTQIILGESLLRLGELLEGSESEAKISAGIQMLERTIPLIGETEVEQRANTQLSVLRAQLALGRRVGMEKVSAGLKSTLESLVSLLSNPAKWRLPPLWVRTKLSLGVQLEVLAPELGEADKRDILKIAINNTEDALKHTSPGTTDWADANERLGHQLLALTSVVSEDEARRNEERAMQTFEEALTVLKPETSPVEWSSARLALAEVTLRTGMRLGNFNGIQKRQSAVEMLEQTAVKLDRGRNPMEWAAAQASLGHGLLISVSQVAPHERIQSLTDAAEAFKQALNVFNHSSKAWARARAEYGRVLFAIADITAQSGGGDDVKAKFEEAIKAYEQAVTIGPPMITSTEQASTQVSLAMSLSRLGTWLPGEEGLSKLKKAVETLDRAILVFQPNTKYWAHAQGERGFALFLIAQRSNGQNRLVNLDAAITTYKKVLTFHSTAPSSIEWAAANGNLGDALLAAGWATSGNNRLEKWKEAIEVFGVAIESSRRMNALPLAAKAHAGLGHTLIALSQVPGQKREDNLKAAIQSFQETLSISESLALKQGLIDANNGLGRAYSQLKQPTAAIKHFEDVLVFNKQDPGGLDGLAAVNHELLFNFPEALRFQEQLVKEYPDDLGAQSSLAESYFTATNLEKSEQLVTKLLSRSDLDVNTNTVLRAFEIANSLSMGQRAQVRQRLDLMIDELKTQPPDFRIDWGFDGTLHFISQSKTVSTHRKWLVQLFKALKNGNRDSVVVALTKAKANFR